MMNKKIAQIAFVVFSLAGFSGCASKEVLKDASLTSVITEKETSQGRDSEVKKQIVEDRREEAGVAVDDNSARGGDKKEQKDAELFSAALEAVYFNYDSASLSSEARQAVYRNFQLLSENSQVTVQIEGHCDERGSDEYNLALGENRAKAAMKYLVSLGIAGDRISTISYGKEKPAVHGDGETAWARNRRAEFVLDGTEK